MIKNHKELSKCIPGNGGKEDEFVWECVGWFHYRNGIPHDDGSMGTIQITPLELFNIIKYAMRWNKLENKNC